MAEKTTNGKSVEVKIDNPDQASTNFYWTYESEKQVFNLQTTIRGILTFEQIQAHIKSALAATAHVYSLGGQAKQIGNKANETPRAEIPPASPMPPVPEPAMAELPTENPALPTEPTYVPPVNAPKIEETFETTALLVTISSGKKYFKIKGGAYPRYGVTVWDEVLVQAGIQPSKLEGREYNLPGYKATYTRKADGKPDKVTKLEKVA